MKRPAAPGDLNRLRLFIVSYCPLWLMLVLRAAPMHGWHWSDRSELSVVFAALAAGSLWDAHHLVAGAQQNGASTYYFDEIDDQGGNAAGYLATYLLPFLGLVPAGWGDWAAYGVYFVVAGLVFIRTDLALVNPTLYVFGWRVISAKAFLDADHSSDQQVGISSVVVICRHPVALAQGSVDVVTLAGCYVVKHETER